MKNAKNLALIGITGLLLMACDHKDLYIVDEPNPVDPTDSYNIIVNFDWRDAPDANPESMAMYLYDENSENPARYIFDNKYGGNILATEGHHVALCINSDNTSWVRLRNTAYADDFELCTINVDELGAQKLKSNSVPRPEDASDEPLVMTPELLWGDPHQEADLISSHVVDTINFYPHELVCHYMVDIYDVENIERLSYQEIDASLTGMADGVKLKYNKGSNIKATMPLVLQANIQQSNLHGEFLTFGECSNLTLPHYLTVYMLMSDGSKWYKSFDVTKQIANAPDPRNVHIILRGLKLPDEPSGDMGGLKPNVNEWQEVNIDLEM